MGGVGRAGLGAGLPTFVVPEGMAPQLVAGGSVTLDERAAQHMRVRRLEAGIEVALRDGQGTAAVGRVERLARASVQIAVSRAEVRAPLPEVHLLVPVADRDRMLWLGEKAAELGCTSWRPVLWHRSRSVSPRGEGVTFLAKIRSRMELALAQSEGAWLPQLFPEASPERAIRASPVGDRFALDHGGQALTALVDRGGRAAVTIAVGPEGGFEAGEVDALVDAGFRIASIGTTILRFETAALSGLAIARTALSARDTGAPP